MKNGLSLRPCWRWVEAVPVSFVIALVQVLWIPAPPPMRVSSVCISALRFRGKSRMFQCWGRGRRLIVTSQGRGATGMTPKIIVVVEDLIFLSKIQQTAKLTEVETETVQMQKLIERLAGPGSVSAVVFDLNHRSGRAVEVLRAMKADPRTQQIPAIAFLSHVQTDLAKAARDAGCDLLLARSAFTEQLPQLLRRYSATPS